MNIAQRSFAAGELTPALYARTDLAKYAVGLRTCRNFIVQRQGGATNRPGTEYITDLRGTARLLPFVFNDAQAYVLAFTDRSLMVVRAGGVVARNIPTPFAAADLRGLQMAQSADVVTITHQSYPPYELRRIADASWTLAPSVFAPTIIAPANVAASPPGGGVNQNRQWVVTSISDATGEESFASVPALGSSAELPVRKTITWSAVPGAGAYRIYRATWNALTGADAFGFIGSVAAPAISFFDDGLTADYFATPPQPRPLFASPGNYPAAVARYQQRLVFGGSTNAPETVWTSRVGDEHNFTVSRPSQDDDAITFTPAAKRVNLVRHLVDTAPLLVLTSDGAVAVGGDGAGVLRPTDVNPLQVPVPGCGTLTPLAIDSRVLYVHARQSTVRAIELGQLSRTYQGIDLSLLAAHLFAGRTLVDWTYHETPESVVWCVRSDGVLLGCTLVAGEDVLAWHRHDTDGTFENVCAIPEGNEDALYCVVVRHGLRYLERMATRIVGDVRDAIFLDAALTYDGRNTSGETVTLSGGPRWAADEILTVTRSGGGNVPAFSADDVGNAVFVTDDAGVEVRVVLRDYVSATVMRGFPSATVPATLQGVARATWSRAVDEVLGLDHLNGRAVSVLADGVVAANPLNAAAGDPCVVVRGVLTLDQPYAVIQVGLPITADLETLDIDTPAGRSVKDAKSLVSSATVLVESSRGLWAGQALPTGADPLAGLDELLVRDETDGYGPIALRTGAVSLGFGADWQTSGRFVIRHIDPLPLTVSAIVPRGFFAPTG